MKTYTQFMNESGFLAKGKAQDDAIIELTRNRTEQKWALQYASWLRKGPSSVPPAPRGIKPERAASLKRSIGAVLSESAIMGRGQKEAEAIKKRTGKLAKDPEITKWAAAWGMWELKIKNGPAPKTPKNLSPSKESKLKKQIRKIIVGVLRDPLD